MKVKVYRVWPKNDHAKYYLVDAPNKHIAKWSGANLMNNEYSCFLSVKDMKAERWKYEEVKCNFDMED